MKHKEIIDEALEPQEFWDDWEDYRDGMRYCKDRTKIRSEFAAWAERAKVKESNIKNKRLLKRRKARKIQKRAGQ